MQFLRSLEIHIQVIKQLSVKYQEIPASIKHRTITIPSLDLKEFVCFAHLGIVRRVCVCLDSGWSPG